MILGVYFFLEYLLILELGRGDLRRGNRTHWGKGTF